MSLAACFLRAVNVGGRRATNDELVAAAEDAGFAGAVAYQAAGNLVVDAGDRDEAEVAAALETALEDRLGFATEVVVRTGPELATATSEAPWDWTEVEEARGRPQVVLCRVAPDRETARQVLELATETDLLHLAGRDLHWLPVAGSARAVMDTRRLHHLLHPATSRTIGTLERLRTTYFDE